MPGSAARNITPIMLVLAIATQRRDGDRVPMVCHSRDAFEEALDGVTLAAVGDPRLVAAARALTDPQVWRGLRAEPGATRCSRAPSKR